MKNLSVTLAGLLVAGAATSTWAQDYQEMRPYVTAGFNHVFEDKDRLSDGANGYSFGAGKALGQYWGLEINGFYDQFKKNSGGANNWREYGGKLSGMFFYSRNPAFSPYTAIGIGGMQTDLKNTGDKSFDPFVDAGVGFFKFFPVGNRDFGLRADVRYRWVKARDIPGSNNFGEPVVTVGLVIPLGARSSSAASAAAALADQQAAREAAAQGPNRSYNDVHFEFDQSALTESGKKSLDGTAGEITGLSQKYPSLKVDLSGHTDWYGSDGYNMGLSERRADSVKSYLTGKGVDAKRITTHAYGENKPKASNETAEGRAVNRRVEITTHAE